MSEQKHPSEINLLQQYMRAVKIAKTTSRMKNAAWYDDALELDVQVHCYLKNEGDVACFVYNKSLDQYERIGGLTQRQLQMADELENFIDRALETEIAEKAKALGVVFYLADELSIAGLGPEHQNPAEIDNLRAMMAEDPTEVLDDKTVSSETHAWRLLPYPGAPAGNEFATAVAVSRKHDQALQIIREIGCDRNLPIRTCALSAPLCAIASLPLYTTAKENGIVGIFNYETFTVLSFYNKRADLMMVRYVPHSGGAIIPNNIGPVVMASATAFELVNPEINVLTMVGHNVDNMIVSLQGSMPASDILMVDVEQILKNKSLPSGVPLEVLIGTLDADPEVYPMLNNATFASFTEEGWHSQDFLSPSHAEVEMYPSQEDMKLLKLGRRTKWVAALLMLGVISYTGFISWQKMRDPAWSHQKQNTQGIQMQLMGESKRHQRWNNLLMDRSKAWTSMELVSQMTPNDGSVILKDVKHRVNQKSEAKSSKIGFQKEWVINGYTNDQGLMHLEKMSTRDGIKRVFETVARRTGSQAYLPEVGQRDITVDLKQRPNPTYNTVAPKQKTDRFRLSFTMTIAQTFPGNDELALVEVNNTNPKR